MRHVVIVIAVIGIMSLISSRLNKQKEARRNDPGISPEHFVITQMGGIMTALFILGVVLGVAIAIGCMMQGGGAGYALIGGAIAAVSVYGLLNIYVWRIEVDGVRLRYRHFTGKVEEFDINQITRVTAQEFNGAFTGTRYKFYSGDKKLFTVDETTDPVYMIDRIRDMGIQIEE